MTDFEKALEAMKDLFGRDYQFTLSTAKDNIPSSRMVDTFFDGESFYIGSDWCNHVRYHFLAR